MGTTVSLNRLSSQSVLENAPQIKNRSLRERTRHGVVQVDVCSVAFNNRRPPDNENHFVITPRGGIFFGTQTSPSIIQKAITHCGAPMLLPVEIPISDSRAHKLLVIHSNGWHAIPSPEVFSRHSGTCLVLGDKRFTSAPFRIRIGDCFRLGSVGVVVSELKTENGQEQRLDSKMLQFLKDEALAFDSQEDMAALAADEGDDGAAAKPNGQDQTGGIGNGERFICYMCYETHDTAEDPLVAPCDCKGDTRYLHVQCLQKWYQSSVCGPQALVIRTTGNGCPACKICGTAYKSTFKKADGRKGSLLEMETAGPYLSLVVVTRHDTNAGLFNTKFRLNFAGLNGNSLFDSVNEISGIMSNGLTVGRSSSCNMVLDYRTVSTVHAKILYENGEFFLQDRSSSNGTMIYLKNPVPLNYSDPIRLRMGRSTITLKAKRSWTSALRSAVCSSGDPRSLRNSAYSQPLPPQELLALMSDANQPDTPNAAVKRPPSPQGSVHTTDSEQHNNNQPSVSNNQRDNDRPRARDRAPGERSLRDNSVNRVAAMNDTADDTAARVRHSEGPDHDVIDLTHEAFQTSGSMRRSRQLAASVESDDEAGYASDRDAATHFGPQNATSSRCNSAVGGIRVYRKDSDEDEGTEMVLQASTRPRDPGSFDCLVTQACNEAKSNVIPRAQACSAKFSPRVLSPSSSARDLTSLNLNAAASTSTPGPTTPYTQRGVGEQPEASPYPGKSGIVIHQELESMGNKSQSGGVASGTSSLRSSAVLPDLSAAISLPAAGMFSIPNNMRGSSPATSGRPGSSSGSSQSSASSVSSTINMDNNNTDQRVQILQIHTVTEEGDGDLSVKGSTKDNDDLH